MVTATGRGVDPIYATFPTSTTKKLQNIYEGQTNTLWQTNITMEYPHIQCNKILNTSAKTPFSIQLSYLPGVTENVSTLTLEETNPIEKKRPEP